MKIKLCCVVYYIYVQQLKKQYYYMQPKKWCLAETSVAYYQSSMPISFTHLIIYFFRCQDSTTSTSSCGPELPYCNIYRQNTQVCISSYAHPTKLKTWTVSSSQASSKIIAYLFTGRNLGKQIITMLRQLIVVSYLLVFSEVTNIGLKNDD